MLRLPQAVPMANVAAAVGAVVPVSSIFSRWAAKAAHTQGSPGLRANPGCSLKIQFSPARSISNV